MRAVVIDTNVLAVANGKAHQAGLLCVSSCTGALRAARTDRMVVLDSLGLILLEYFRNAHRSGQPGAGDAFAKWLNDHQRDPRRCEIVEVTPRGRDSGDFEEFPDDPELRAFDRSDRKFVATARASLHHPRIQNATDTDWWQFRDTLHRHDVTIEFLCPELMR